MSLEPLGSFCRVESVIRKPPFRSSRPACPAAAMACHQSSLGPTPLAAFLEWWAFFFSRWEAGFALGLFGRLPSSCDDRGPPTRAVLGCFADILSGPADILGSSCSALYFPAVLVPPGCAVGHPVLGRQTRYPVRSQALLDSCYRVARAGVWTSRSSSLIKLERAGRSQVSSNRTPRSKLLK